MNRTLKLSMTAAALGLAFSCASAQDLKSGAFVRKAPGMNGDVIVETTISQNKITSVKVLKHAETQGIGTLAVETLPNKIVEAQSPDVDAVAGATMTSNAIKNAVERAVEDSGADLKFNAAAADKPIKYETLETDVVIVGGGGAGMSAAIRTRMNGLSAVLIDKMPFIGGAASISSGQVVAYGSKLQKEFGVKDDTAESMIEDFQKNGAGLNDLSKLSIYAREVGPTIDWINEAVGVKFVKDALPYHAEYAHPRALKFEGGAKTMAQTMRDAIKNQQAQVLLNTRVESLIVEDGKVAGVKALDKNSGVSYTVRAKKTILATGGFGNNKELLAPEMRKVLYYGPVSSTGDGLKMARDLGAKTQLMQYAKLYPNGIETAPGIAKSTLYANYAAFEGSGLFINVDGKRFTNEKASNRNVLEPLLKNRNGQAYLFMDEKTWQGFLKRLPETGVSTESALKYLAEDGKSAPLFVKGATIEEAARKAGINAENLVNTVARYNEFVKNQKDEDFSRPVKFMKESISAEGPYYIVEQKPRMATTMGGLCTDDNMNVVREDGSVIPNLYAAGELVGGVMGDDSPAGANVGWALTSGRYAADCAAAAIKTE